MLTIQISTETEHMTPEEVGQDCGDGFLDAVYENLAKDSKWGWCAVMVRVISPDGKVGDAILGACSYGGYEDFIKGGYLETLVETAIDNIREEQDV